MEIFMELNMQILYALAGLRNPFLDYVMMGITYAGSEAITVATVMIIFWCVNKYDGYYMMANFMCGTGIAMGMKVCAHVPRPFKAHPDFEIVDMARSTADGFSFPSGHSENATMYFGTVAILYKNKIVRIICIVMIPLVMFSRLYLGAHYPTDVLGGFALGCVVLFVLSKILKNRESDPKVLPLFFSFLGAVFLVMALIIEFGPWTRSLDPEVMAASVKNMSVVTGLTIGVAAALPVERKYVNFDTHAVWWAQILKAALGSVLLLAVRSALKPVQQAVFGTLGAGEILCYFIMSFIALCIWPMTFRWFSSLGQKA